MGCAVPDTSSIRDPHAERMVLCGLLHRGGPLYERICVLVQRPDFFFDVNQHAFDLLAYSAQGSDTPIMADAFLEECRRSRRNPGPHWLGGSFGSRHEFTDWLIRLWCVTMWMIDMPKWATPTDAEGDSYNWAALAAAAKVAHLAARRRALHAANEAIHEALNPSGDAESIDGMTNNFFGE